MKPDSRSRKPQTDRTLYVHSLVGHGAVKPLQVKSAGTPEGAKKAWDTRGRKQGESLENYHGRMARSHSVQATVEEQNGNMDASIAHRAAAQRHILAAQSVISVRRATSRLAEAQESMKTNRRLAEMSTQEAKDESKKGSSGGVNKIGEPT